jgi:hypothetical protein
VKIRELGDAKTGKWRRQVVDENLELV